MITFGRPKSTISDGIAQGSPFSYFQHQFRISYRIILREKELHLNIGVYNPSKVYLGGFSANKDKI